MKLQKLTIGARTEPVTNLVSVAAEFLVAFAANPATPDAQAELATELAMVALDLEDAKFSDMEAVSAFFHRLADATPQMWS